MPTTPISRRNFTLCLGATAFRLPAATDPGPWDGPATIHKVYLATPKPTWPYRSLDFKQEVAGADAILVLDLTTSTSSQFEALDKLDTPLLLFQRPLTSWAFMDFAGYIQRGKRANMINSSEFADLIPHMHMLRAMHHVANSKLLVLRPGSPGAAAYQGWTDQFGTKVELPSYQEFKDAYDQVGPKQAREAAGDFTRSALKVIEPKPAEILDSARFHLASLEVLRRRKANAVTIACLGGFRRGG